MLIHNDSRDLLDVIMNESQKEKLGTMLLFFFIGGRLFYFTCFNLSLKRSSSLGKDYIQTILSDIFLVFPKNRVSDISCKNLPNVFLIFPEKRVPHLMQIVSHEMVYSIFWEI